MHKKSSLSLLGPALLVAAALCAPAWGQEQPTVTIPLSPTVAKLLDDPVVSDAEKRQLAIFHGQWDRVTNPTVAEQARMALLGYDLTHPSLRDEAAPLLVRAEAALIRGEAEAVLEMLGEETSAQARLLRGQAHQMLGQFPEAVAVLLPLREGLIASEVTDAAELTATARAVLALARLEGRPAQDYHTATKLFAKARDELDRLYWPAHLYEAQLLLEKNNAADAQKATVDAMKLNPRSSEALFLMGAFAAGNFDFDTAEMCMNELRRFQSDHLLAAILEARMRLIQKDTDGAFAAIEPALALYPKQRELLALLAAAEALTYDEEATKKALDAYDALSARSAEAYYTVGEYLSFARQYAWGEAMLREAIEREPNWPEPRIELGLLLMQSGDEEAAAVELRQAARLDPFHLRAANQLKLVEELLNYAQIETEHFIIKYKPGVDVVLARDMPEVMEQIYADVTRAFKHEPANKTLIEIMPDEQWFGVRITGMPEIWTIAACTGDVISMTPPRSGPKQRGAYNWANVIRHEYVHTVTLDQTANRIPHWFTEACAVSMETTGRSYENCLMLASALHEDRLFTLDNINWGFIRPRTPIDRPLAYAQADWMLEYVAEQHGHDAIVTMLEMFRTGATDLDAIEKVTGQTPDRFYEGFKSWARQQVEAWGLGKQPPIADLPETPGETIDLSHDKLHELLAQNPKHPDLLRAAAAWSVKNDEPQVAWDWVRRYAAARPVDPWSHRQLVLLASRMNRPQEVIGSLAFLDKQENEHGEWAFQLAKLHRAAGRLDDAAHAATRALQREPYSAPYRELAAAIELQRGEVDRALHHMEALPILEPTRAIHFTRLAALYHKLGDKDKAHRNALKALEVDPNARVQDYLDPDAEPVDAVEDATE